MNRKFRAIYNLHVTEVDIIKAIDKLDPNAAAGPDGIPALLFKKCKNALAGPLAKFWNLSLKKGKIPDRLKEAIVIPVPKPGKNRSDPESFRPVSLTSHITKIFERVIKEFIQNHLECNRLLGDFQHGFRQHKSCLTQLLIYQEEILKNLECGYACDSVYLDFAKAFDKVDLGILGHHIRAMGIYGEIGILLANN